MARFRIASHSKSLLEGVISQKMEDFYPFTAPFLKKMSWIWVVICLVRLYINITHLVGGLVAFFYFPIYWECHHPNWLSYFSAGFKPPTRYVYSSYYKRLSPFFLGKSSGHILDAEKGIPSPKHYQSSGFWRHTNSWGDFFLEIPKNAPPQFV